MKNIITYLSALITFIGFLVVLIGCENVLNVNKVTTIGVFTMCFGAVIFLLNSKDTTN